MSVLAQIKELIDPLLDERVYRDEPPEDPNGGPAFPYSTIFEDVERSVELPGDGGTLARRTVVQVDLWQLASVEDDDLADQLVSALDGVRLANGALRMRVRGRTRFPEDRAGTDDRIIHHAITVAVPVLG